MENAVRRVRGENVDRPDRPVRKDSSEKKVKLDRSDRLVHTDPKAKRVPKDPGDLPDMLALQDLKERSVLLETAVVTVRRETRVPLDRSESEDPSVPLALRDHEALQVPLARPDHGVMRVPPDQWDHRAQPDHRDQEVQSASLDPWGQRVFQGCTDRPAIWANVVKLAIVVLPARPDPQACLVRLDPPVTKEPPVNQVRVAPVALSVLLVYLARRAAREIPGTKESRGLLDPPVQQALAASVEDVALQVPEESSDHVETVADRVFRDALETVASGVTLVPEVLLAQWDRRVSVGPTARRASLVIRATKVSQDRWVHSGRKEFADRVESQALLDLPASTVRRVTQVPTARSARRVIEAQWENRAPRDHKECRVHPV